MWNSCTSVDKNTCAWEQLDTNKRKTLRKKESAKVKHQKKKSGHEIKNHLKVNYFTCGCYSMKPWINNLT